ncbi:alpha-hydroxy acid oxidase [Ramlibacter sp.]|uniref:alpha-hydroxy acid oxidase n=1 Tax=Ramlibacter sp. TaxID=1917967 RepID=UPI003D0BC2D0
MASLVAHNIADLRLAARRRVPRGLFEYVDRGTEEEVSLRANREAWDRVRFVPRPLAGVATRSQRTEMFGRTLGMPLVIAPTGMAGLLWHRGELALARAAKAAQVPFTLSTYSITSLEEVAAVGGNLWFQLYLWPDIEMSRDLVRRAQSAGFGALVVTIDSVVNGNREHNRRNGFSVPIRLTPRNVVDGALHPRWTLGVMARYLLTSGVPEFANFPAAIRSDLRGRAGGNRPASLPKHEGQNWDDIRRLRDLWQGPLVVKGVLHADDALRAIDCGADAVVVSNHGGRALDGAIAPLEALPDIAQAVGDRAKILIDGAVIRGSDIAKAIALGAHAVMAGRAPLWGVAAGGEAGVALALDTYRTELDRVMAYLGCRGIEDIHGGLVRIDGQAPPRREAFRSHNIEETT